MRGHGARTPGPPEWFGIRAKGYKYLEYHNGERELYDLTKDPGEMENIYSRIEPSLTKTPSHWLYRLSVCAGAACREVEGTLPAYLKDMK